MRKEESEKGISFLTEEFWMWTREASPSGWKRIPELCVNDQEIPRARNLSDSRPSRYHNVRRSTTRFLALSRNAFHHSRIGSIVFPHALQQHMYITGWLSCGVCTQCMGCYEQKKKVNKWRQKILPDWCQRTLDAGWPTTVLTNGQSYKQPITRISQRYKAETLVQCIHRAL